MTSKYEGLSGKSPKEAADIVGKVEKRNYLAHTIREIELAILGTQGTHYHIITYTSKTNLKSKITFYDQCCEIRLTSACEETDDPVIRLILAHELGHLVHNIDKLKNPEIMGKTVPSDNEEIYAWQFAYYLIDRKSFEHQNDMQRKKFVYHSGELKQALKAILDKRKPEICDNVIKLLSSSAS